MFSNKLLPIHWFVLALIQAVLAWYFFYNIQVYIDYQNVLDPLFEKAGFNEFIIRTLFSDAAIILVLTLPFILHYNPANTFFKNHIYYVQFLTLLLVLISAMSLVLSLAGNVEFNYLIFLMIGWWLLSHLFIAIPLFLLSILPNKWLAHFISIIISCMIWINVNKIEQPQPLPLLSQIILKQLTEPLEIKAFVTDNQIIKNRITTFIKRYQVKYPQIKLNFINPNAAPAQIKAFHLEQEGELLLQYAGQITRVAKITDYFFTKVLHNLLHQHKIKVVFLQGHGERTLLNNSPFEYGLLSALLQNKNIEVVLQNTPPEIDRKTLWVIANPRQPLTTEESNQVLEYLKKGGNLLWLLEPILENDGLYGLNKAADFLGLKLLAGRLWNETLENNQTLINITNFPSLENMKALTATFSEATALQLETAIFNIQPLLKTSFLHLKPFEKEKVEEPQTIFTLGFLLQRSINTIQQRIAIIGDSDFISNAYLEKNQNANLIVDIIDNLTEELDFINLPIKNRADTQLIFDFNLQMGLTGFFLFVLPTIFIIIGWRQFVKQVPPKIGAR